MKQILLLLIVLVMISSVAFAAAVPKGVAESDSALVLSQTLKKGGSFKNSDQISLLAAQLDQPTRDSFYRSFKKPVLWPTVANGLLGFGIGSFIQKDWLGGGIGLGLDLVGGALFATGVVLVGVDAIVLILLAPIYAIVGKPTEIPVKFTEPGVICILAGLGTLVANRIFEIIRPIVFGNSYNKALDSALNRSPAPISVAMAPSFTTVDNLPQFNGIRLAAKIEL